MECRQSIHRLGGCHWAEFSCFAEVFFRRVKDPTSSMYIILRDMISKSRNCNEQTSPNVDELRTMRLEVDLSAKGLGEAKSAGGLLKSEGIKVDMAFTSYLKRDSAMFSCHLKRRQYNYSQVLYIILICTHWITLVYTCNIPWLSMFEQSS